MDAEASHLSRRCLEETRAVVAKSNQPVQVAIEGCEETARANFASALAWRLGLPYLSTGSLFRHVAALMALRAVRADDWAGVLRIIDGLQFRGEALSLALQNDSGHREFATTVARISVNRKVQSSVDGQLRRLSERGIVLDGVGAASRTLPDYTFKFHLIWLQNAAAGCFQEMANYDGAGTGSPPAPGAVIVPLTGNRVLSAADDMAMFCRYALNRARAREQEGNAEADRDGVPPYPPPGVWVLGGRFCQGVSDSRSSASARGLE